MTRKPLGNPRRHWKQDHFILSTFSISANNMRDAIENCAEAGFNLLELGWASHEQAEEALRLCEELGINLLFQDFSLFGGMQDNFLSKSRTCTDVRPVTNKIRLWKHVIGYYVWDEPYVEDQLAEARRLVDLFEQADPTRLPFTVAIPSYNKYYTWKNGEFPQYLERYITTINPPVLSLDFYPIHPEIYNEDVQLDTSYFWCDLGQMRKLARNHQLPLWFYYQGMNLLHYPRFTFPMIRMMMYAAAMYGAKGLQHYKAVDTVIDENGQKGPFFYEQQAIHREFRKLGNTLMALESVFVFHSSDLLPDCPYYENLRDDIKDSAILCDPLPKRTSAGELKDTYGNRYLLILNRDVERNADLQLPLKYESRIYEVSKENGRQSLLFDSINTIRLQLAPGDAVLYRLQPATSDAYTIEYRLEKN